jgi:hypothetical protein
MAVRQELLYVDMHLYEKYLHVQDSHKPTVHIGGNMRIITSTRSVNRIFTWYNHYHKRISDDPVMMVSNALSRN